MKFLKKKEDIPEDIPKEDVTFNENDKLAIAVYSHPNTIGVNKFLRFNEPTVKLQLDKQRYNSYLDIKREILSLNDESKNYLKDSIILLHYSSDDSMTFNYDTGLYDVFYIKFSTDLKNCNFYLLDENINNFNELKAILINNKNKFNNKEKPVNIIMYAYKLIDEDYINNFVKPLAEKLNKIRTAKPDSIIIKTSQDGGRKKTSKLPKKEILGKLRCIYNVSGSRKEHIKHKGKLITVTDYKKIMKANVKSKK
jgi:hypothetical protein